MIHPCIHSFTSHSPTYSLIHLLSSAHLLTPSLTRSSICVPTHLLAHLLTHSLVHLCTHSFTHSLTHSLARSRILHLLIHSRVRVVGWPRTRRLLLCLDFSVAVLTRRGRRMARMHTLGTHTLCTQTALTHTHTHTHTHTRTAPTHAHNTRACTHKQRTGTHTHANAQNSTHMHT